MTLYDTRLTPAELLTLTRDVLERWNAHDVDGVVSHLTDDVTWTTPGPPDIIPYAGIRTGRDQVAEYFTAFGSSVVIAQMP